MTNTPKPQANNVNEILGENLVTAINESQSLQRTNKVLATAKQQLLAEVLDMIPEELDLNDSKLTDRQVKNRRNYNKGLRDTADAIKERFK